MLSDFISLEDVGLEEAYPQPIFGLCCGDNPNHSIPAYVAWWSDGEDSRYSE